jgi:hypothetical protein
MTIRNQKIDMYYIRAEQTATSGSHPANQTNLKLRGRIVNFSPSWHQAKRESLKRGSVHVRFVVDTGIGTGISPRSSVLVVSIFPPRLHIHITTWVMNNRTVGGCSSKTQTHPTDMDNKNMKKGIRMELFFF